MPPTILGTPGMIEQPRRAGWSPSTGPFTIRTWKGTKTEAANLGASLRNARYEYEVANNPGGLATITARVASDEPGNTNTIVTSTWERLLNIVEKSVFNHPNFATLSQAERKLVRKKFGEYEGQDGDPATVALVADDNDAESLALMEKIYNDLTLGIESYILEQPVVRLTELVDVRTTLEVSRINAGKILTYNQMVTNELAPEVVLDDTETPAAFSGIARYGYRKGEPQITQQPGGLWQVVTEWASGIWSNTYYTDAVFS